ncbi:MAG: hypothetical protein WC413_04550 [Candidatus Nanoarchaeia archaeon]
MDTKDKTIIGLVVLLVLAVLLASGILTTGKAIKVSCEDTDGDSIYLQGAVSGTDSGGSAFGPYADFCSVEDSNILVEYTCDQFQAGGYKRETKSCGKGCENGACKQ